jgi:hypothetical protein
MMEKAPGIQLFKVWTDMSDWDQLCLVKELTELEGQITKIALPASGSLYLRESMTKDDNYVALNHEVDPSEMYCIGPSCERGWYDVHAKETPLYPHCDRGPCQWHSLDPLCEADIFLQGRIYHLSVLR